MWGISKWDDFLNSLYPLRVCGNIHSVKVTIIEETKKDVQTIWNNKKRPLS